MTASVLADLKFAIIQSEGFGGKGHTWVKKPPNEIASIFDG